MIVTETGESNFVWKYMIPIRYLSGFYPGFAVFEHQLILERNKKYEFLISGREPQTYQISDFMLRPIKLNVIVKNAASDSSFNNFPKN
jgi:hypothetical protein